MIIHPCRLSTVGFEFKPGVYLTYNGGWTATTIKPIEDVISLVEFLQSGRGFIFDTIEEPQHWYFDMTMAFPIALSDRIQLHCPVQPQDCSVGSERHMFIELKSPSTSYTPTQEKVVGTSTSTNWFWNWFK